jgi:hypothetical protein
MRALFPRPSIPLIFGGAVILAIGWAAVPSWASDSESPGEAPETVLLAPSPPDTVLLAESPPETVLLAQSSKSGAAQFTSDCVECDPPKRFFPAFGELMAVQFIPWSLNHYVRDAEWAAISPATWWTNMSNPWLWDNNKFVNNQFSHPYHGSLYFNAGRANGYNFWESMVWSGGGSMMWELFGEAWAPSPNDWFNTTLGGISLGEMLWRVSSLTLDNTSTGSERTLREIGAAALNPVRGFSRLVHGETHGVRPNPDDWRPDKIDATFAVGRKQTSGFRQKEPLNQTYGELLVFYGDEVEDLHHKPFSAFEISVEITAKQIQPTGPLTLLRTRGNLGAHMISRSQNQLHQLAFFMEYEYINSPVVRFGGQAFHGGLVSRWGQADRNRTQIEVLATLMPISALRSDYYVTLEGRDYDYGPSFGGWVQLQRIWQDKGWIQATARGLYTPIVSGFNGDTMQAAATAEFRYFLKRRFGLGAYGAYYHRSSWYDDFADVQHDGRQVRAFLTYAFPRWEP